MKSTVLNCLLAVGITSGVSYTSALLIPTMVAAEWMQASQTNAPITTPTKTPQFKAGVNRVTFPSEGVTLVGNLYLPSTYKTGDKLPAIIVSGAWITVKEQMAGLYAKKLAPQGFAALAFDFRYYGESGGEPRQYESPSAKIQDIKNAIK